MKKVPNRYIFVICRPDCIHGDQIVNRIRHEAAHLAMIAKKKYSKDTIKPEIARKIIREKLKLPLVIWEDGTIIQDIHKMKEGMFLEHIQDKIEADHRNYLDSELPPIQGSVASQCHHAL